MKPIADPRGATPIVLKRLCQARQLSRRGAEVEVKGDEIFIRIDGIEAVALNEADLGIFYEIFVERTYEFDIPGPFLVLDVGANIGISALFFTRYYEAEVRAFELVPSTAQMAERNIGLNPELASRIALEPYGICKADAEFELAVEPTMRSSNSMYGLVSKCSQKESVRVRDAAAVLQESLDRLGGRKLVLKLDAEGAEYEIVARLAEAALLDKIDVLFLEWHEREGKNPEELRQLLRQAGFRWFEREHGEAPVGYISAFRT